MRVVCASVEQRGECCLTLTLRCLETQESRVVLSSFSVNPDDDDDNNDVYIHNATKTSVTQF